MHSMQLSSVLKQVHLYSYKEYFYGFYCIYLNLSFFKFIAKTYILEMPFYIANYFKNTMPYA